MEMKIKVKRGARLPENCSPPNIHEPYCQGEATVTFKVLAPIPDNIEGEQLLRQKALNLIHKELYGEILSKWFQIENFLRGLLLHQEDAQKLKELIQSLLKETYLNIEVFAENIKND